MWKNIGSVSCRMKLPAREFIAFKTICNISARITGISPAFFFNHRAHSGYSPATLAWNALFLDSSFNQTIIKRRIDFAGMHFTYPAIHTAWSHHVKSFLCYHFPLFEIQILKKKIE
jgi:hypothetical protein